jgi:hypothetical protein
MTFHKSSLSPSGFRNKVTGGWKSSGLLVRGIVGLKEQKHNEADTAVGAGASKNHGQGYDEQMDRRSWSNWRSLVSERMAPDAGADRERARYRKTHSRRPEPSRSGTLGGVDRLSLLLHARSRPQQRSPEADQPA